jgi:hypothetical protein
MVFQPSQALVDVDRRSRVADLSYDRKFASRLVPVLQLDELPDEESAPPSTESDSDD